MRISPSLKNVIVHNLDYRRYYMDYILLALHTFFKVWNNRVDNRVVYDIWRNNKSILAPFRVL